MKTYKEVFTFYEDKDIHKQIQEVEELELKVSSLYGDIRRYLNDETVERLDSLIGQISRAYELQGFAFAQEVYQKKSDEDKAKAEELALQELKMSRKKKKNAKGKKGVPTRMVTSNGLTKTISEWLKLLQCSSGTLYCHLNKSTAHFDKWVSQRMELVGV